MFKSYLKIAWRNIRKNKVIAVLNIGGLAIGMAVAMLIGLWVWDELSYNNYYKNYDSIAQLARREMVKGEVYISEGSNHFPIPLAGELRSKYSNYFSHVALATESGEQILTVGNNMFTRQGMFVEPAFTDIFSFKMISGTGAGFTEPGSILLSRSLAVALYGNENASGKILKLNNARDVKVTGVFADVPASNRFHGIDFFCPFSLLSATFEQVRKDETNWGISSYNIFVQTVPGVDMRKISSLIKDVYWPKIESTRPKTTDEPTTLFLHPMKDWHLRSEWKNGVHAGGQIQLVWMFGIIGAIVLLLACINFMNLNTARSEKRAKEVGIRKTFGSLRKQLVKQFLSESLLIVCIAFLFSIILVYLSLDPFNSIAGKQITFSFFTNPIFWCIAIGFMLLTAFISGSYPAWYLSAFQPVKVLKGTFRAGRAAVIPRRIMAGLQFTVSIILIIGTVVVYRQIQVAQNRPIGYDRNGLIRINMNTPDLNGKYDVLQKELFATGGVAGFAQSSSATTENTFYDDRFEWEGKDARQHQMSFVLTAVTVDFGKTVGWQFTQGRDFSKQFSTDNASMILNESAVKYMQLREPIGKKVKWNGNPYTVVGVIRDMITESPYKPVQQSIFLMFPNVGPVITIRLNPKLSAGEAIRRIEPVFRKMNPSAPFEYTFIDDQYNQKFAAEQRIGVLSGFFTVLAVLISCLGIFGLASFVAQQRMKEVSVRKVLGASVIRLWSMLTGEFVLLVITAFVIATPVALYLGDQWLQQYAYRTKLSWWIFPLAGGAALLVTLLTVSFHAIRAAMANPIKSLRDE